eukprot:jgi/Tetstr1/444548/TSEL_000278.t1
MPPATPSHATRVTERVADFQHIQDSPVPAEDTCACNGLEPRKRGRPRKLVVPSVPMAVKSNSCVELDLSPAGLGRGPMPLRRDRPLVASAATTAKGVAEPTDGILGPPPEQSSGPQPRKRGRPRKAGVAPVATRVDAPRQVEQTTHA